MGTFRIWTDKLSTEDDKHCEKQQPATSHSLPGYLFCYRREKRNSRKNQVTIMYTDYCHWLSINLIIHSSYKMVPDLPFPVHVFELFPMHATLQENFRGHYEACSSKAGVFNFHCSCLRALCSKGQNVNQMKTAVLWEADTWGGSSCCSFATPKALKNLAR